MQLFPRCLGLPLEQINEDHESGSVKRVVSLELKLIDQIDIFKIIMIKILNLSYLNDHL